MDKKTKSWILNGLFVVLLALLIWPTSRTYFQQGLMKIGLFSPKLSSPSADNAATDPGEAPVLAPAISFRDPEGKVVQLSDLKGKVVFINFWATWCPPCIAEMPSIEALYKKFEDNQDIVFLIVEIEANAEKAQQFMSSKNLSLPIYFPESEISEAYLSGSIPTTVIIDKTGAIASRNEGMADYSSQEVSDYISELIHK